MSAIDQFSRYLDAWESRLRTRIWTRGAAIAAMCALLLTVGLVWLVNRWAFAPEAVTWARWVLFLALGLAGAMALIGPLLRLNRRQAARTAETLVPELGERLITFHDRQRANDRDPFLPLLAEDALNATAAAPASRAIPTYHIAVPLLVAMAAAASLIWMIQSGSGWIGYGASLLWLGHGRTAENALYQLIVEPGNVTVRRGANQTIRAKLLGLPPGPVRLNLRGGGASAFESVDMQALPDASTFEFVMSSVVDTTEYSVTSGPLKSPTYKIKVVDLPAMTSLRVIYKYPAWSGLGTHSQEGQGDVRAVVGTVARVEITTDKPLPEGGVLALGPESGIKLTALGSQRYAAEFSVQHDGLYSIAALSQGERVRLSEDFFIEAIPDKPPTAKFLRPTADQNVSPIEEVRLEVAAEDDFALKDLSLHYTVNGGPEQTKPFPTGGQKQAVGKYLLELESFGLKPGDVVAFWASMSDARQTANTDIMFLAAQPFERNYKQSQERGGGGGGAKQPQESGISERQKEIISATWNTVRDKRADAAYFAEVARFLSDQQKKLSEQAQSLSKRMKSREVGGQSGDFAEFSRNMDAASDAMNEAVKSLGSSKFKDALTPEQKALQSLLRAESVFRDIQLAFQRAGAGGGAGGAARDLENLFDLELDTEKNQYETASSSPEQRQNEIDKALDRLKELARRQQELAKQQQQSKQNFQFKYQQEMLRREAEELRKQLEQLQRGQQQQSQGQQQASQQSQQQGGQPQQTSQGGKSGQQSGRPSPGQPQSGRPSAGQQAQSSGQPGRESSPSPQQSASQQDMQRQMGQRGDQVGRMNSQTERLLKDTLDRLNQAIDDMRDAQRNEASARRASERLQDASSNLGNARRQDASGALSRAAEGAKALAAQQRDFSRRLGQQFGPNGQKPSLGSPESRKAGQALADEKDDIARQLADLEAELQNAARQLQATDGGSSSKIKQALGELQQSDAQNNNKGIANYLRRGLGAMVASRDQEVTRSLEKLSDAVQKAQQAAGQAAPGSPQKGAEQALQRVEQLRRQLQQLAQGRRQAPGSGQPGKDQSAQGDRPDPRGQPAPGQPAGNRPNDRDVAGQGRQGNQGQPAQGTSGQPGPGQAASGKPGSQPQGQRAQGQQGQGQAGPGRGQAEGTRESGQQPGAGGSRQPGGQSQAGTQAGGQAAGGSYGAMNRGDFDPPPTAAAPTATDWQEALRQLSEIGRQLQADPEAAADLQRVIQQMQRLDPSRFKGNPELLSELAGQLLPGLEKVELHLRQKVDEGGQVRVGRTDTPPPGYATAVAEYFRRLSRGK